MRASAATSRGGCAGLVPGVLRLYNKWEEANFPQATVPNGISSEFMQHVWCMGTSTQSLPLLRDTTVCSFSYAMNGLEESAVMTFALEDVGLSDEVMSARLSRVKS